MEKGTYNVIPLTLTVGKLKLEQDEKIEITESNNTETTFIRLKDNTTHTVSKYALLMTTEKI